MKITYQNTIKLSVVIVLTMLALGLNTKSYSQTTLYSEDFETYVAPEQLTNSTSPWRHKSILGSSNKWYIHNDVSIGGNMMLAVGNKNNAYHTYNKKNDCEKVAYDETTSIDASSYESLTLTFSWICEGEASWDYGKVCYSLDGGANWTDLPDSYQGQSSLQNENVNLSILDGQVFHIGFKWINDASVGGDPPFEVDNIVITGIETGATLTVGSGTNVNYWNPFYSYFTYGYSANIYEASEINNGQTFNSISWNVEGIYAGLAGTSNNIAEISGIKIYMAHISDATFDFSTNCPMPTSSDNNISDWTEVYDGDIAITSTGWYTLNLDTKFDYDGTSHLLVYVYNEADLGYDGDYAQFYSTSVTDKDQYDYNDTYGSAFDECTNGDYRPNIKLGFESDCSYEIGAVSGTNSISDGENTTLTVAGQAASAAIKWQWRPTGATSWIDAVNTYKTAATYIGPYLGQNTDYRASLSLSGETCFTSDNANGEYAITVSENSAVNVWTGQTSVEWGTGTNWTQGAAPSETHHIYIGNEYANEPELADVEGSVSATSLTVQASAVLNYEVSGPQNPQLSDYLTNYGTILQTGGGWFYLSGTGSSNTLYNLGEMSSLTVEIAGDLTATSDLDVNAILVSSGTMDMNNNSLTTNNGVNITGGSLELGTGAWNVTGGNVSITSSGAVDATEATVTLNGSSEQTVATNGNEILHLVINNSNGIKLGDAMQIDGSLTLTNGCINTNGNRLTMTSTVAGNLSGYSNTNFIISDAAGPFRRFLATNTDTYAFPVGQGAGPTNYFRMDLVNNNLSNGGAFFLDVYVKTNSETGNNVDSRVTASEGGTAIVDIWDKEWIIKPNSEPASGTFGLRLFIENMAGLEDNKFTVFKRDDGSSDYAEYSNGTSTSTTIPSHGSPGRVTTGADPYAEKLGFVPPMAGASGGNGNSNLPIELLDFDADLNDDGTIDITWTTASEINNEFFTIERSVDGMDFATIIERDGAGTSNHIIEYAAVDRKPIMGTSYYRLKQTDYDGAFVYSKLATVTINESSRFRVWPNPATDNLQIQLDELEGTSYLKIYNDEGRLVYEKEMDGSFNRIDINLSGFDQGLYFITHAHNGMLAKTRFVKN